MIEDTYGHDNAVGEGGGGYSVLQFDRKLDVGVRKIGSDLALDMDMGYIVGALSEHAL